MRNIITANSEYGWELFFVVLIAWVAGARTSLAVCEQGRVFQWVNAFRFLFRSYSGLAGIPAFKGPQE